MVQIGISAKSPRKWKEPALEIHLRHRVPVNTVVLLTGKFDAFPLTDERIFVEVEATTNAEQQRLSGTEGNRQPNNHDGVWRRKEQDLASRDISELWRIR